MFAAHSDHKAILAEFTPPSFETEDTVPRFYCPETILQDSEAMEDLETSLKSIHSTGDQWWEEALSCIQKKAVSYQREHKNKKQSVELQALRLLRGSTRDSVTPAVYQFLSSLGIAAADAATAYTLLVGVYEKAQRDRTGMETLSKLKGVITTGETSGDLRTRRNELYRLMRELQERKKLQQLVSRTGSAIRGAKAVAKELVDHWDKVSTPTGTTEEECVAYLKALGVEQRLRKAGRLLFKQLSLDIVHEGLKRLNSNSSPGLDGFSVQILQEASPRSWYTRRIGRHGCLCARSTEISGVHGCGGHCDCRGMGHPGKPGRCCAHGVDSAMALQCRNASCHAPPSPGFGTFGPTHGRHGNRRQPSGDERRPQTNCACAPACSSHTPFNDPSFQSRRTGGW